MSYFYIGYIVKPTFVCRMQFNQMLSMLECAGPYTECPDMDLDIPF